jgi:hypothetical protein
MQPGTQYKEEITHSLSVYYFCGREAAIIAVLSGWRIGEGEGGGDHFIDTRKHDLHYFSYSMVPPPPLHPGDYSIKKIDEE